MVGVITRDAPDVLCHAAVRARNSAVLLAACCEEDELAAIEAWQGQQVQLQLAQVIRLQLDVRIVLGWISL